MIATAASTGEVARQRGNALLAIVIIVLALAGLAAAFMERSVRESARNSSAAQQTKILYIAEAGVTHAVSEILSGSDGNVGTAWAPIAFSGGSYRAATVDHGDGTFTVTSNAVLNEKRMAIEVVLAPESVPIFAKALFGDLDLGASGNVFTDSYDSDLGDYASQATEYDTLASRHYAGERGDLASNRNIIIRGGVTVIGNATPGPGYAVMISGTSVYVKGSTAPAPAPTALQPLVYTPPIASSGDFSAPSAGMTVTAGVYRYDGFEFKTKGTVTIQGGVTMYIDDDFSVSGQANLVIEPDSSLTIYHNGPSFSLTGGGVLNQTNTPASFKLFSAANTIKFAGTSGFYGAVYAPNASITPVGTTDIYGSFVGR